MKKVEKAYRGAEKIILIQDNLNTHNPSSFYETFAPKSAFRLSQRFQMVHTPKKASWLNMADSLSKQCLDHRIRPYTGVYGRIGNMETFSKEVYVWARQRDRRKATISWQFTKNKAREKLTRHYCNIRNFDTEH